MIKSECDKERVRQTDSDREVSSESETDSVCVVLFASLFPVTNL